MRGGTRSTVSCNLKVYAERLLVPEGQDWKNDALPSSAVEFDTYSMSDWKVDTPGMHAETVKSAFEFIDKDVKVALNPSTFGDSVR